MRTFVLLIIFAGCFFSSTNAQTNTLADSLLMEVNKASGNNKKQFDLYYTLSAVTMADDIQQSISYALKAKDIAKKAGLKEEYAKSFLILTTAYIEAGKLDESKTAAITALQLAQEADNKVFQYYAHSNMGIVYRRQANFDSSLYHYLTAIRVAEKLNDTLLSAAYSQAAVYYLTVDDYEKAEEYNLKSLEMRMKYKDSLGVANIYNNIGILNRDKGDYKKALHYYKLAAELFYIKADSSDIAFIYNDLGAIYSKMGKTDSGGYYLRKSIDIRERHNLIIELPYTYNYLGENYEREGDLMNAERFIKKALALAIAIKNNKQHYEALESLSDFYSRNKIYDSAYSYLQQYRVFRDSIRRLDNEKVMAELNTRYETEKKEKRIQEQQFEITRKNYMLGVVVVLVLSIALLLYSAYRRNKLKQATALQATILKQQELATKAVLEAEENERQRIAGDLHDGVGQIMSAAKINLATVAGDISFSSDVQRERFENALKLVDESCAEVRNVSHNIMPNSLLRNSLAAAVRLFINKIDQHVIKINLYTEGLNEKLDERIETMLYRIVQECVNNVIKHSKANTLDISLVRENNEISITIEDNGQGFDATDKKKLEGIGMKNIQSRIEYLKGTVEWDSASGRGTVVSIYVPLQTTTNV